MPQQRLLKEDIARIRSELDEEYYQLGKTIFEATDKANMKITTLLNRLIQYRMEIHGSRHLVVCDKCGKDNEMSSNFCSHCGQMISDVKQFPMEENPTESCLTEKML